MVRDSSPPAGGRDPSAAWRGDHPWAKVYDRITDHRLVGSLVWRVGMSSDLDLLHRTAAAELGALGDGASVLDLPCGGGVVLRDVPRDLDVRYVAADISPAMLARTRDEADRVGVEIETVEADVSALEFTDGEFDLVFAFTSLHCFPDPERAVHELARVTRPGGRLVGSTLLRGGPARERITWFGGTSLGVLGPGCTRDELEQWLRAAGIDAVEVRSSGAIHYFSGSRST